MVTISESNEYEVEILPAEGETDRAYLFIHASLSTRVFEIDYSSKKPEIVASARDNCWIPIPLNSPCPRGDRSCPYIDIRDHRRKEALLQLKLNK